MVDSRAEVLGGEGVLAAYVASDDGLRWCAGAPGGAAAWRASGVTEDQPGGCCGAFEAELDGDAEVGVGGQDDAGVSELVGDDLQFGALSTTMRELQTKPRHRLHPTRTGMSFARASASPGAMPGQ